MKAFSGTSAGSMAAVGAAGAAVAAGVGLVGVMSAKSAAEFQSSMLLIQTQAGASASEVKNMTDAVLALAPAVGASPQKLAEALFHVESVGLRGKDALDALKVAAMGAKVGHSDLEATTNVLLGTLTSGIGGVHNMHDAMGTLNAIVGSGNMRMGDLVGALSTGIMPAARTFGVSLQSIGAAIATMTNATTPADEAATRLRMTLSLMAAPSSKAQKDLASIGISHLQLAEDMRGPGGLHTALMDLKKHLDASGLSASQQAALLSHAFGGGRSSAGILTLLGAVDRLGVAQEQIGKGAETFGEAWKATTDEATFGAEQLGSSLESIVDSIGLGLLPLVSKFFSVVNPVVTQMATWAASNRDTVATILLVAGGIGALLGAAVILGPVLGAIGAAIGIITSPIILIGGAIVALAAHFGLLGAGAKGMVDGVLGQVAAMVPVIIAKVSELARAFVAWIGPMIGPALSALAQFAGQVLAWLSAQVPVWVGQLGRWAAAFIDWIAPMIPPALAALGQLVAAGIAWVAAQLPKWTAALLKWVEAFLAWLAPMIPPLLAELGKFAAALIGWIAQQVPVIALAMLKLGQQLVAWVDNAIPGIVAALGRFLGQILAWFQSIAPTIAKAASGLGGSIANNLIAGIGDIGKAIGDKLNTIPGLSLVGGAVGGAVGAAQGIKLPGFATGGTVPGTGPQLIIAHGGEQILNKGQQGRGGGPMLAHITVNVGGQQVGEVIERLLFNSASGASSGFAGSSVTD